MSSYEEEYDEGVQALGEYYDEEEEYEEEEEGVESESHTEIPLLFTATPVHGDGALDEALERFVKSKKLKEIDGDMRRPLLQHITRRKVEAIESQDYDRAEQLVQVQNLLKRAICKDVIDTDRHYSQRATKSRIEHVRRKYARTEQRCEEKKKEIEKYMDEKEAEIRARHKVELKDFSEFWNDPSTFYEFSKPSGYLLQIRKQEKKMALLGDFQAARAWKSKGDEQEKVETQRAQQRAKEAVEAAYRQLVKRQKTELDAHRGLREKLTGEARLYTEEQLYPLSMAIKKLETTKEDRVKVKRLPKVSQSRLVKQKGIDTQLYDDRPAIPTPRTAEKLAHMRALVGSRSLRLAGVNARPFIKRTQRIDRKERAAELKARKDKDQLLNQSRL